ncbi:uncharacterized protein LOC113351294 [Papaver somniferum]|uniref:uncharacterized protein LOC113351294 n=1 Tax=Papaver somniferum TaxID=3469 RepID=UPI000E6FABA8|nr:uncharacterized protein LOC113351294 [Papaver somniferum]
MEEIVQEEGKEMKDLGMPQHTGDWIRIIRNQLLWEQSELQFEIQESMVDSNVDKFNTEQRNAFEIITDSVVNNLGRTFFLNGSAGTGKTFVYNTLAVTRRSKGDVVLTCNVDFDSIEVELFPSTKLIIWDEVAMQNCIEAVDRTLRDVRSSDEPSGGIIVVLGGDFKQTFPVVQKGRREQIIDASIRSSVLWRDVNVLKLTQNTRLESQDPDSIAFAEYLLQVCLSRSTELQVTSLSPETKSCQTTQPKRGGNCVSATRLRVEICEKHVIVATILTGDKAGEVVFIPCISLTPSSSHVLIRMIR